MFVVALHLLTVGFLEGVGDSQPASRKKEKKKKGNYVFLTRFGLGL